MMRTTLVLNSLVILLVLSYSTLAFVVPVLPWQLLRSSVAGTALGMFTGIVEEMGTVVNIAERGDMVLWDGSTGIGTELTVQSNDGVVMDGAYLGCSISVNGVCLTATSIDNIQKQFTVGLAPETLDKTYFRYLQRGQALNLERATEIGGRNSGHFVQGHVDGTATIVDKRVDGDSLRITLRVDDEYVDNILRYVVPKGFIAIDGTSLTVVDVNPTEQTLSFMLVEYTQKKIVIPQKSIGEKVNIEVDVLGKYSESAMASLLPRLEALEAKVKSLERRLSQAGGGNHLVRNPPARSQPKIQEGTPKFRRFIQEGSPGYTNPDLSKKPQRGDYGGRIKWVNIQGSF